MYQVRVPDVVGLKNKIFIKAHSSLYTTYPKNVKMYQGLRKSFWWAGMKRIW